MYKQNTLILQLLPMTSNTLFKNLSFSTDELIEKKLFA